MSQLSEMIEVDALRFIEPDYSSLVNKGEPGVLICEAEPENGGARILIDEDENPVLFAVKNEGEWYATGWLFRPPSPQELEIFEKCDGEMYQEQRSLIDAVFRMEF
ncbi:MAG TPA: hypothetical protein O0X50_04170, partial [Methanocorpusculum sp.]|nr:hypothetical protein [Methanocorpusculum sp.]